MLDNQNTGLLQKLKWYFLYFSASSIIKGLQYDQCINKCKKWVCDILEIQCEKDILNIWSKMSNYWKKIEKKIEIWQNLKKHKFIYS